MSHTDASVCICAYKRPAQLDALLRELQAQREGGLTIEIVVADNDPDKSSAPILDYWSRHSRFPLVVLHLPTPNIALARNACVEAARGEWIAFIDDDEWPEPDWILSLLETCREFRADIAFGPVLPTFPDTAPAWLVEGRFFERTRHETGTAATLRDARTSNALVRKALLTQTGQRFDPAFGRTGGSDHVLFRRLEADGASMVWADDAIVHEHVPADRMTLSWLLRRSFRTGQVATRARLLTNDPWTRMRRRSAIAMRAAGNFVAWSTVALLRAPFSRVRSARAAFDAASYLGRFLAVFGHRYQEYRH